MGLYSRSVSLYTDLRTLAVVVVPETSQYNSFHIVQYQQEHFHYIRVNFKASFSLLSVDITFSGSTGVYITLQTLLRNQPCAFLQRDSVSWCSGGGITSSHIWSQHIAIFISDNQSDYQVIYNSLSAYCRPHHKVYSAQYYCTVHQDTYSAHYLYTVHQKHSVHIINALYRTSQAICAHYPVHCTPDHAAKEEMRILWM